MSATKTKREITEERDGLSAQIEQMIADHAETVADLEKQICNLSNENDELTNSLTESQAEGARISDELDEIKALLTTSESQLMDAETALEKAVAALNNPAHVDASMIPTEIDQAHEDAEADREEAEVVSSDESEKTIMEQYESMEPGEERQAFLSIHEREIFEELRNRSR